jgi:hypothetical protein
MSTPTTTTTSMFFDEGTYEASDDESAEAMTFDLGCQVMIPFGKHRGTTLGEHVRTKAGRSYLRYLLDWDGLFEELRQAIECVVEAYNVVKKDGGSNKRRRT